MHDNPDFSRNARASLRRLALLALLAAGSALSGCAGLSGHMESFPNRAGAPPYPDDPEANGNPAKAWYN